MRIRFVADKNDKNACQALGVLEKSGQEVSVFEKSIQNIKLQPEAQEILVAVFTSPEPKLIKRGHASRTASHRLMEYSPEWASSCQMLIAVAQDFKDTNLNGMVKEWLKIVNNLENVELAKVAPWGPKPVSEKRFNLYCEWLEKRLGLSSESLNLNFTPRPSPNFTDGEVKIIKNALRVKKDKRLTYRIIKTAQSTPYPVGVESTILTGTRLIDLILEKRILIESDLQVERILNCLWRGLSGKSLQIIIPLCPAWTYDENGYNFCGLEENSKGICYEMMSPELNHFLSFLKELNLNPKLLIWVADIEWLDLEGGAYVAMQGSWSKEKFMSYVQKQCELVAQDLASRSISGEVKPLLKVFPEDEYLREQAAQEKLYLSQLKSSETKKHFSNTLKMEAVLYKKQCGVFVDPVNPHPKVKDALIKDMVSHLAPLALLTKLYANDNYLFFLQSGPFAQLYEKVPYVLWRVLRKGAF
ncbi:MAG: hypothetical protein HYX21_00865 [Candidatus Yanofskybacteria bacterium]|nr:hypothetical protein [Candidatus Yanofskybacteria bacterium]